MLPPRSFRLRRGGVAKRRERVRKQHGALFSRERDRAAARTPLPHPSPVSVGEGSPLPPYSTPHPPQAVPLLPQETQEKAFAQRGLAPAVPPSPTVKCFFVFAAPLLHRGVSPTVSRFREKSWGNFRFLQEKAVEIGKNAGKNARFYLKKCKIAVDNVCHAWYNIFILK